MTDIYIAWDSDIAARVKVAANRNEPEQVRKLTFLAEKANMVFDSWLLSIGGKLVGYEASMGMAEIPADRLGELEEMREKYAGAVEGRCSIGVGTELYEAQIALEAAKKRSDERAVVFYTPDILDELEEQSSSEDYFDGEDFSKAEQPSAGEATKIAQGQASPSAAMPSPLPQNSPGPTPQPPTAPSSQNEAGGGAPGPGAPQNPQQLKQAIISVLKDVKAQTPTFEKMKQENPDAYEAVMGLIEAMLAMGKQLLGQQPQQGMQKSEPLEKMALIHDDPKNPRMVYRVMDDSGRGAYQSVNVPGVGEGSYSDYDPSLEFKDDNPIGLSHKLRPGPYSDFPEGEWADNPERYDHIFGFEKPEDAVAWFGDKGLERLKQQGAKLHAVPAAKVYRSMSGRQVIFVPHRGVKPEPVEWPAVSKPFELALNFPIKKSTLESLRNKFGKDQTVQIVLKTYETLLKHMKIEPAPEEVPEPDPKVLDKDEIAPHHHLSLPTGSAHNNKVKVLHSDGTATWVSVRAGQVMSDGHAKSSRLPSCNHEIKDGGHAQNPVAAQLESQGNK